MNNTGLLAGLALLIAGCPPPPEGSIGKLQRGQLAPTFDVPTVFPGSSRVDLAKLRGQVVLLDFWATFCDPCKTSLPHIGAVAARYKERGLVTVGISEDEPSDVEAIAPFIATYRLNYPVIWDVSHAIGAAYHLGAFPCTVVIDRAGVVRHILTGYKDGDESVLDRVIAPLLNVE